MGDRINTLIETLTGPPIPRMIHRITLESAEQDSRADVLKFCTESLFRIIKGTQWCVCATRTNRTFDAPDLADLREDLYACWDLLPTIPSQKNPLALQTDLLRFASLYVHGGF